MSGFVFGVNFVFVFLEDIGYIARVAYVFDGLMSKLGVQGKSICPMIMGFGCTIGGAAGARVIDNYGQRLLTFSLSGKVEDSLLYHIATFIESVTRFFGMGWQTFMAFIASAFAKEAVLGVLNAVFAGQGSLLSGTFEAKSFGVDSNVLPMLPVFAMGGVIISLMMTWIW